MCTCSAHTCQGGSGQVEMGCDDPQSGGDILFDEVQLLGSSNEYAKKQSFPVESTK